MRVLGTGLKQSVEVKTELKHVLVHSISQLPLHIFSWECKQLGFTQTSKTDWFHSRPRGSLREKFRILTLKWESRGLKMMSIYRIHRSLRKSGTCSTQGAARRGSCTVSSIAKQSWLWTLALWCIIEVNPWASYLTWRKVQKLDLEIKK